jgi:dipeptidyl aminopeptidase/acylaminoacyl peptidase
LSKTSIWPKAVFLVAGIFLSAMPNLKARDRNTLDPVIDSVFALRHFNQVEISPDGKRVAWVESAIYVQELSDPSAQPRRIAEGRDVAWSPDSARLAFISDGQLCVAEVSGGHTRRLTHLTGFLANPKWSPDGKTIALLFTENAPRAAGPLEPMTPDSGVVGGQLYEQRLTTVDVASARMRQLTPPDLYVYEYDWSPDGKKFVATAAHGNGDDNWYVAGLYIITAESGQTNSIYQPPLQIGVPRWSPDNRRIAFVGGLMSDEGNIGGNLFLISPAGGEARDVTPGIAASISSIHWMPSSQEISFAAFIDGLSGIGRVKIDSGDAQMNWSGAEEISEDESGSLGFSMSRDGKTSAMIRSSLDQPPEVWAGRINAWKQITKANNGQKPAWGKARSLHWKSDDFNIQGWLVFPRHYNPSKRYPMVVLVHGGPGWAHMPRWPSSIVNDGVLSSAGYFVLLPNPRGSFGQGEKFTRANVKDFGYGDLRDILAGVDEVVKTLPVDNDRIGITGWSYGGFMSMWAVTQTHRFHAAVAGAGIANWQSYYGENDLDQWMIPFFGASVYDDPAVYAKSSPINFIKNVNTPTLVLVGDRDGECPAPQSYEFWHALKTLGVKTQLVIYANEGHHIAKLEDQRDIIQRMVEWFDRFLK